MSEQEVMVNTSFSDREKMLQRLRHQGLWIALMLLLLVSFITFGLWAGDGVDEPGPVVSASKNVVPEAPVVVDVAGSAASVVDAEMLASYAPIKAPVNARPSFVSEIEWQVLQGVAAQHAQPDKELARLVDKLRFSKAVEQWRAWQQQGSQTVAASTRQALAARLLAELPARVKSGDIGQTEASSLQARLQEQESAAR